jgi:hypothetical protein
MKAAHFAGDDVPLHANELRNPTTEQLDALSKFFREQHFARLAVTMSKSAVLPSGKTPLEIWNYFRFRDSVGSPRSRSTRGGHPVT